MARNANAFERCTKLRHAACSFCRWSAELLPLGVNTSANLLAQFDTCSDLLGGTMPILSLTLDLAGLTLQQPHRSLIPYRPSRAEQYLAIGSSVLMGHKVDLAPLSQRHGGKRA